MFQPPALPDLGFLTGSQSRALAWNVPYLRCKARVRRFVRHFADNRPGG
jgi:hypothetical protein